jgi:hypothetical protein
VRAQYGSHSRQAPLIGVNYSHFSNNGHCSADATASLNATGIISNYYRSEVAATVASQMRVMRRSGIQSLRIILWHTTQVGNARWGVVSSAGGMLTARARAGLVGYLTAARRAGFARLTISLGPAGDNNPSSTSFDSSKLEENWELIQQVRALAERSGPRSIHIDLMNEAPPNSLDAELTARVMTYLAAIYRRYVEAYGNADVSVSTIASQSPRDTRSRLRNLIEALESTRLPLPRWFDVHPSYRNPLRDLRVVDGLLTERKLDQPLILSEVAYNDRVSAEGIARFERQSKRAVLEVDEWPLTRDRPCRGLSVSPPYIASAYIRALGNRPPHSSALPTPR